MKILIVDDNHEFCTTLADTVSAEGWSYNIINNPVSALEYLQDHAGSISLMLLDIEFNHPKLNGMDVLEQSVRDHPHIPVIMITGVGTIEVAVKATRLGAANFIEKSAIGQGKLREVMYTALEKVNVTSAQTKTQAFLEDHGIIGKSSAIIKMGETILRYGRTELAVLITGETGTGKKLVAHALHGASKRKEENLVTVDIPNIPSNLFQSELFGHVKGAFSGATEDKIGLFKQADKGTVFLDEIGDLPLELQANLLLPIEEKKIRKLGSVKEENISVRFVSATDRNLPKSISDGTFREQLYHRLRECEIHIPPLNQRREDIPLIVQYYTKKHNTEMQEQRFFDDPAIDYLQGLDWKGNVRQLLNILRVVMQTSLDDRITVEEIQHAQPPSVSISSAAPLTSLADSSNTLKDDIATLDRLKIESTLEKCKGNVSRASSQLGISRETLHQRIKKYEIDVSEYRKRR
jgi:DNA-binding NtrC family response regulator